METVLLVIALVIVAWFFGLYVRFVKQLTWLTKKWTSKQIIMRCR